MASGIRGWGRAASWTVWLVFAAAFALGLLVPGEERASAGPVVARSLGRKPWQALSGVAAARGKLYVRSGITMLVADKSGKFTDLSRGGKEDFHGTVMAELDDKLYLIQGGALYEVEASGKRRKVSERYMGEIAMVGMEGRLYVASDGSLWEVEKTGGYKELQGGWTNIQVMTALDGKLYIVRKTGELYEVDRAGQEKRVGTGNWEFASQMVAANGKLYILTRPPHTAQLHEVDKAGKARVLLPEPFFEDPQLIYLAALDGALYVVATKDSSTAELFTVALK